MFNYEFWGATNVFGAQLNMALEEYFLKNTGATGRAAIRFYSFQKDAIILGYAQAPDAIKIYDNSFSVARRPTGGSHVQVGPNVLSYMFCVPQNGQFKGFEDMRAYYAERVAMGLSDLGIDDVDVDNKASIITVGGIPVGGHAIACRKDSILMHGKLVVAPYDVDRLGSRVHLGTREIGGQVYSEYSILKKIPAIATLGELSGRDLPYHTGLDVAKQLISNAILRRATDGAHSEKRIDKHVMHEAFVLAQNRYGNESWTRNREPAFTDTEIQEIPGEQLRGYLKKGLGYCLFSQVPDHDFKKMADPIPV